MNDDIKFSDILARQCDNLEQVASTLDELQRAFWLTGNQTVSNQLADARDRIQTAKDAIRRQTQAESEAETMTLEFERVVAAAKAQFENATCETEDLPAPQSPGDSDGPMTTTLTRGEPCPACGSLCTADSSFLTECLGCGTSW